MPKPHFSAYRELPLWVVYQHFTTKTGRPPEATPSIWPAKTVEEAKQIEREFRVSASGRFIHSYGEVEVLAGPIPPLGALRDAVVSQSALANQILDLVEQFVRAARAKSPD